MELTSTNNEKVKIWSKLKSKKYRDEQKMFLIEGDHLVNIALKYNLVEELICLNDEYEFTNKYLVNENIMQKITSQVSISNVAATIKYIEKDFDDSNIIILDQIQDPGNLGTIIRSAVAFGFNNILLGEGTVDIYNDKVLRASEGMIFNVNFKKENINSYVNVLKTKGYKIIGTDVAKGIDIKCLNKEKLALIIGNEGNGLDKNIICDDYVYIKMNESCESLNAGIAASILMYEVYNGK